MKLKIDASDFDRTMKSLSNGGRAAVRKGVGIGLRKIGRTGKAESKREIRRAYTIKAGTVDKRLSVKADVAAGFVEIRSSDKRGVPIVSLGTVRATKKGVTFRVLRGAKRTQLRHAFMRKGQVLERATKDTKRLPVRIVKTLGVATMFASDKVQRKVLAHISQKSGTIMRHEIDQALRRAINKATR